MLSDPSMDIHNQGGCDDDCLARTRDDCEPQDRDSTYDCPHTCPDRIKPFTNFKSTKKAVSCSKIEDSPSASCRENCPGRKRVSSDHHELHSCEYDQWKTPKYNDPKTLPPYAQCQMPRFRHASVRDMAYEMLPTNLRKDLHARAAKYLHGHAQRCSYCGGGKNFSIYRNSSIYDDGPISNYPQILSRIFHVIITL